MASSILVIDIGTSSAKALVFCRQGTVLADAEVQYATDVIDSGRHEQNPESWWTAAVAASRQVTDGQDIAAITLSGTMQSVIAVDHDCRPVRPAILYSDARASREFDDFIAEHDPVRVAELLGNYPNALLACFKMKWLQRHEPNAFDRTSCFHSGAKDFLLQRLTGACLTDPTAATTVGLMDQAQRQWSAVVCDALDIPIARLPAIKPADYTPGGIKPVPADELGVCSGTPVYLGAGDAGAATIGAGLQGVGSTYIYVGTTAWVAQIDEQSRGPATDGLYALSHPSRPGIIKISAMLSGGDSAAWYSELSGKSLAELDALLPSIDQSPTDVMFLPYLKGERSPFNDPAIRGALHFLARNDGPPEIFYAVLEGLAFALRANLQALSPHAGPIRLLGGGAISPILPQLIADSCRSEVEIAAMPAAATAYGAFLLTCAAMGLDAPAPAAERRVVPREQRSDRADERFKLFTMLTQQARELAASRGA